MSEVGELWDVQRLGDNYPERPFDETLSAD